ncbi:MAG TPA: phosphoribosyltransferase [Oligoflexia bacterium]|nr:phosphoribosyltransferase [Oligoflexia bacterium]HMP47130.1 phosphoribosyltransferase [Oligoflexia bacterium]
MSDFHDLFEKVTERFSVPVKLSKNCESTTFYRVEYLNQDDISYCADYLAGRVLDCVSPIEPEFIVEMPGSSVGLAKALAGAMGEIAFEPAVISLEEFSKGNGKASQMKGKNIILSNDVITTARSCLEAHSKLTLSGANVVAWAALIDRTFGPGPVPILATLTGEPVTLLE